MWWKILIAASVLNFLVIYAMVRVGAKADEDSAKWFEKQRNQGVKPPCSPKKIKEK